MNTPDPRTDLAVNHPATENASGQDHRDAKTPTLTFMDGATKKTAKMRRIDDERVKQVLLQQAMKSMELMAEPRSPTRPRKDGTPTGECAWLVQSIDAILSRFRDYVKGVEEGQDSLSLKWDRSDAEKVFAGLPNLVIDLERYGFPVWAKELDQAGKAIRKETAKLDTARGVLPFVTAFHQLVEQFRGMRDRLDAMAGSLGSTPKTNDSEPQAAGSGEKPTNEFDGIALKDFDQTVFDEVAGSPTLRTLGNLCLRLPATRKNADHPDPKTVREALKRIAAHGLVTNKKDGWTVTPKGREFEQYQAKV